MAFFIPLVLTSADPITVNVQHIVYYRPFNKNATQIILSGGHEIYVEQMPGDITEMLGSISSINDKLDEIELQIEAIGAQFDRLVDDE